MIPRWSLKNLYEGPKSAAFRRDLRGLDESIAESDRLLASTVIPPDAWWLAEAIRLTDQAYELYEQLESYSYAAYSVDTGNEVFLTALHQVSERAVPLAEMRTRFRTLLAEHRDRIHYLLREEPKLRDASFYLREQIDLADHQMDRERESLAAALARCGADAWSRLQESISSNLTVRWDGNKRRTMVELRLLASDPDRDTRRRAWRKELEGWRSVEIPLAYALNGVKGTEIELNRRRGWTHSLERSVHQNRMSRAALDNLIGTMRESLPLFRRYLHAKARYLQVPRPAFYDLFAPTGDPGPTRSFEEALEFIGEHLRRFDPEMGSFAHEAVERGWIDAEPRSGKVGGAYCIDFPRTGESRILANFDGSRDSLNTLAHELGHAWHSHCLRHLPASQRSYPMVLAETASIFNETLIFHAALESATPAERIHIVEQYLQDFTQVIVDILSRFEFESAVMERRESGELSPGTLRELMRTAQLNTYGDALDPEALHPYMWAVKGHYYRADLAFYNYPYAFGRLFSLALFQRYREDPQRFPRIYRDLLRETGRNDVITVAGTVGVDIESARFPRSSLEVIEQLVLDFETMVADGHTPNR